MELEQTLEQLDGQDWGEPEGESYVVTNCHRLRRVPLKDFTVEDLRLMIGQQIGLEYLVPLALDQLEHDPWAEGMYYEGDLRQAVTRVPTTFWEEYPTLSERWQAILAAVASEPPPELDEASVVCYALLGTKHQKSDRYQHYDVHGNLLGVVHAIAVCRYETGEIYLFHCDQDWHVIQDDDFPSVEEARTVAAEQYLGLEPEDWKPGAMAADRQEAD